MLSNTTSLSRSRSLFRSVSQSLHGDARVSESECGCEISVSVKVRRDFCLFSGRLPFKKLCSEQKSLLGYKLNVLPLDI